ncbi:ArsJ-associated glyceraldehyde-3-phosphate dehydrogenase [Rhodopirellula sp. SWK7]|uniref:ArsJ-associated glyceraldehyde-3-phosphate dehydrogenase n=1 Tax=Rhodopirellula sp. SWK7 TaxID=595460 RepID=UPI0002BE9504|nr:ArsJ-associated glyceraldehyde-3-phosphate dehydrogenase [Rhodopirellula sp. SWK7]EMI46531.1 Glyceraldehyde-3-phosphate dehydrogenase, type I [Rhodopirellula sp. SWK7]
MKIRVGINGFGRMGRLGMRAAWEYPEIEIVHINELKGDAVTCAHLLEFDTVHGRWRREIDAEDDAMIVDGKKVTVSAHATPEEVPWKDHGVDIVVESSGKFRTPETLNPYFDHGVRKVVVAAPVKDGALNVVMGCNDHLYDPQTNHIVTAASCTTNCLAPVVKVIHENIGIEHGVITTLHDVTNTQVVVDAPHKDLRRARSCLNSLIPTTTGSAKAITMIYPELQGKLNGLAVRIPLLNASLTDCVFEVKKGTNVEEVNGLLREAAGNSLKGILGFESKPLVSADYVNDVRSGIVDGPSTMVVNDTQVKILTWYDNEVGYANRMMELVKKVACALPA